jgi:hypothetical protein
LNTDAKLILSKEIRHSILQLAPNKQLLEALAASSESLTAATEPASADRPADSGKHKEVNTVDD